MRVRWTPVAADDLQSIANYLFENTPANAERLIREIYAVPPALTRFSKLWPYRTEGSYARVGNAILPLCH
jgi:plasmid stabilization system protein ParE